MGLGEHVYCTKCAHFDDTSGTPSCPYQDRYEIRNSEDSMRVDKRPYYVEKKEAIKHNHAEREEIMKLMQYSAHFSIPEYKPDIEKLVELLREIWWMPDWGVQIKGKYLWLHTAGWSENEEIISILTQSMFWTMHWYLSKRGGHYCFKIK